MDIPGVNKKRSEISKDEQKKSHVKFPLSWFLALEIAMAVAQFCVLSKGVSAFCMEYPPSLDFFSWNILMASKKLINT